MLEAIKRQLLKIIDDIDCGNSDVSGEEEIEIVKVLNKYTRKDTPMSKYQAYTYLNISRATFDNLVREGRLPKGKKIAGFKELVWYKKDLNEYIKNGRATQTH